MVDINLKQCTMLITKTHIGIRENEHTTSFIFIPKIIKTKTQFNTIHIKNPSTFEDINRTITRLTGNPIYEYTTESQSLTVELTKPTP
jgi:hypothetical protein